MKLDLRTISKKKELTEGQLWVLEEEFAKRGVIFSTSDTGYTISGDKKEQELAHGELRGYIKKLREIDKLSSKIEKFRRKENVDHFKTLNSSHLVELSSSKVRGVTGIDNYIVTLNKILSPDANGLNRVQQAGERLRQLEELKYESFEDQRSLMKTLAPDVKVSKYMNKDGSFKSKSKRQQFIKLFSERIIDNYEEYKEEGDGQSFFSWFSTSFDKDYTSTYKDISINERKELYQEYVRETIKHKKTSYEYESAESENYAFNVDELSEVEKHLGRTRRKRK